MVEDREQGLGRFERWLRKGGDLVCEAADGRRMLGSRTKMEVRQGYRAAGQWTRNKRRGLKSKFRGGQKAMPVDQ
jgi:hypothetical protein